MSSGLRRDMEAGDCPSRPRRDEISSCEAGRTDLYEEPFTSFGMNAVDKLFSEGEIGELVALVKRLAA